MNKRDRWTILDVDENTIKLAKKYAKTNGYTLGLAVTKLLQKGLVG